MFTRVYNYAKQKHIPASFLMKFRYLVEREGKVRRTVAMMGTVLRNSKWADKSYTNINPLQYSFELNHYFHFVTFSILTLLFYITNSNNIFLGNLFGLSHLWWFLSEDFSDWSKTLIELATFIIPTVLFLLTNISSSLFVFSTTKTPHLEKILNLSNNTDKSNLVWDNLNSKSWSIIQGLSTTRTNDISTAFQLDSHEAKLINFELEYYLYNIVSLNLNYTRPVLQETPLLLTYPQAYDLLKNQPTRVKSHQNNIFTYLNITTANSNQSPYFYFNNMSYQDLNLWLKEKELTNLSLNLMSQGDIVNTLRWAYRYNNLHRRSIYNSHKLTESKKLLSGGYFDSSSTFNNLWFSDQYARDLTFKKRASSLTSLTQIRSNWNLLYRSSFNYSNLTNSFKVPSSVTSSDVFTRLSFYESSFHFFLNRIKFFSSLRNHTIKSLPSFDTKLDDTTTKFNNLELLYTTALSGVLKQKNNSIDVFTNFNKFTQVEGVDSVVNKDGVWNTSHRDILLVSKDADVLTHNASLLFNLTSNSTSKIFYYNTRVSNATNTNLPTNYSTRTLK